MGDTDSTDPNPGADPPAGDPPPDPPAGDELGDAGKAALRAERQSRKEAEQAAKAAQAELSKAKADGLSLIETAKAEARAEARSEVLAEADKRIIRAEVKAAATGKLRRPEYALRLLDLDQFTVADDGAVDENAISSAIDELVKTDPDLAVNGKPGPLPGGGARPSSGTSMDDLIRRKAGRR